MNASRLALVALIVGIALSAAGCSREPTAWSCDWSPTIDDNWHNDVMCSNGVEYRRPNLRPKDDFVTKAEIMAAARKYEEKLNAELAG